MENVNLAQEISSGTQNWCYSQKAPATAKSVSVENGATQNFLVAPAALDALNIQPYKFITPVIGETEKALRTARFQAYGNSMGSHRMGW